MIIELNLLLSVCFSVREAAVHQFSGGNEEDRGHIWLVLPLFFLHEVRIQFFQPSRSGLLLLHNFLVIEWTSNTMIEKLNNASLCLFVCLCDHNPESQSNHSSQSDSGVSEMATSGHTRSQSIVSSVFSDAWRRGTQGEVRMHKQAHSCHFPSHCFSCGQHSPHNPTWFLGRGQR